MENSLIDFVKDVKNNSDYVLSDELDYKIKELIKEDKNNGGLIKKLLGYVSLSDEIKSNQNNERFGDNNSKYKKSVSSYVDLLVDELSLIEKFDNVFDFKRPKSEGLNCSNKTLSLNNDIMYHAIRNTINISFPKGHMSPVFKTINSDLIFQNESLNELDGENLEYGHGIAISNNKDTSLIFSNDQSFLKISVLKDDNTLNVFLYNEGAEKIDYYDRNAMEFLDSMYSKQHLIKLTHGNIIYETEPSLKTINDKDKKFQWDLSIFDSSKDSIHELVPGKITCLNHEGFRKYGKKELVINRDNKNNYHRDYLPMHSMEHLNYNENGKRMAEQIHFAHNYAIRKAFDMLLPKIRYKRLSDRKARKAYFPK